MNTNLDEIDSVAYSRPTENEIKLVYVTHKGGEDKIGTQTVLLSDFKYLKDVSTNLPSNSCSPNDTYMKDRCNSCPPGHILIYYKEANLGFTFKCELADSSIQMNYLNDLRYNSYKTCFENSGPCNECGFERECPACPANYFKIDGKCSTCPHGCFQCEPTNINCISCWANFAYFQNKKCYSECQGTSTYKIESSINKCQPNTSNLQCNPGQITHTETNGTQNCINCKTGFVRRERVCISSCPYGEVNRNGNCVSCPP